MIVSEKGIKGIVIKNNCRRFEVMSMSGRMTGQHMDVSNARVYCESGALLNQVVRFTIEQGLSGLEYQLGLPGTAGGGVRMNSMFHGEQRHTVGDNVVGGKILKNTGDIIEVDREYFQFGFDYSSLQKSDDILLTVTFAMQPMDKKVLWERGQMAVTKRVSEQPRDMGVWYTYRNMVVTHLTESSSRLGIPDIQTILEEIDAFSLTEKDVKIFQKRYNYLLNSGNATSKDVEKLIEKIKEKARTITGVELHFEPHVVGE